jgi:hypothetical protein
MQKSPKLSSLGFAFAVGLLSGCSGSDPGPITSSSGPAAAAEDQRTPQSDALTSQETALVGQANSEPVPAPKPDL